MTDLGQEVVAEETESETLNLEQSEETSDEELAEVPEGEEESEESVETDESPENEEETDADWDEWRTQEELPDSIDSPEALAASYKESLVAMKRGQTDSQRLEQVEQVLKSRGMSGVDALLDGSAVQQVTPNTGAPSSEAQGQAYFAPNPAGALIDSMVKSGGVAPEQEPNFRSLANVVDKALTPQFQLAEKVMTQQSTALQMLYKEIRNLQWGSLDPKVRGSVDRAQADQLIGQGHVQDYDEAIKWMAFKGGDVLSNAVNKAEERGRSNAKKKLRRGKAIRKGKESVGRSFDFENYRRNGEWDLHKLSKLPSKDSDELLQAYAKKHG